MADAVDVREPALGDLGRVLPGRLVVEGRARDAVPGRTRERPREARVVGAPIHDAAVTSAAMLVLSNLISNVPAVILWLPVVPTVAAPTFIWLAMAMTDLRKKEDCVLMARRDCSTITSH